MHTHLGDFDKHDVVTSKNPPSPGSDLAFLHLLGQEPTLVQRARVEPPFRVPGQQALGVAHALERFHHVGV